MERDPYCNLNTTMIDASQVDSETDSDNICFFTLEEHAINIEYLYKQLRAQGFYRSHSKLKYRLEYHTTNGLTGNCSK